MTDQHSNAVQEETEKITTPVLLATSLGLVVFLLVVICASVYGVRGFVTKSRIQKENYASGQEVQALKEQGSKLLKQYSRAEGNSIRIPIEIAMKKVVEEQNQKVHVQSSDLNEKAKKKKTPVTSKKKLKKKNAKSK